MRNLFVGIIFFSVCSVFGQTDLTGFNPNSCAEAVSLGELAAPEPCPSNNQEPIQNSFVISNENATPSSQDPYLRLSNCTSGDDMANPASDIWFSFVAPSNRLRFVFSGSEVEFPNFGLYRGTSCGSIIGIDCSAGAGFGLDYTVSNIIPGQTYYVQITGGFIGDKGEMDLDIYAFNECSECAITSFIDVTPGPVNGTYEPGQIIEFSFRIVNWVDPTTSYPHGIVPTFGSGWDLSTLEVFPDTSCDGFGEWGWYDEVIGSVTGISYGPGFFYDSRQTGGGGATLPLDGDPGNNWGDGCLGEDANFHFRWKIEFPGCTSGNNADLGVDVAVYGDGESGSWTTLSCFGDLITPFNASGDCCQPPEIVQIVPANCHNVCNGKVSFMTDAGLVYPANYKLFDEENQLITGGVINSAPVDPITINVLCPGSFYVLEIEDNVGCLQNTFFEMIEIEEPKVIIEGADIVCYGQEVPITIIPESGVLPLNTQITNGTDATNIPNLTGPRVIYWTFEPGDSIFVNSIVDNQSPVNCTSGPLPAYYPEPEKKFSIDLQADSSCVDSSFTVQFSISPFENQRQDGFELVVKDQYGTQSTITLDPGVFNGSFEWNMPDEGELYILSAVDLVSGCFLDVVEDTLDYGQYDPPGLTFVADRDKICIGQLAQINYTLDGVAPFTLAYFNNGSSDTIKDILTDGFFTFSPEETSLVTVISLTDNSSHGCPFVDPLSDRIEVFDSLRLDIFKEECINTPEGEKVEVTVEAFGGDTNTYLFNGTYSQTAAIFQDPNVWGDGQEYTITIEDNSGCPSAEVKDIKYCACTSQAPGLIRNIQRKCSGDPVNIILDPLVPPVLDYAPGQDIHDTMVYIVHESAGINLLNPVHIIPGDATQLFHVPAIDFDRLYYLSAVVGNKDVINDIIKLQDTCLNVARGIPFIFSQAPVINYTLGEDSICAGDETPLYLTIDGKAPFTVVYDNQFGGTTTLEGVQNLDSISLAGTFTRDFIFKEVRDVNAPPCVTSINDIIHLHVYNYVEAALTGDTAFCVGDSAELNLNLAGAAPWYLTYSIDGIVQPEYKTYNQQEAWYVKVNSTYDLLAVRDTFCTGEIMTDSIVVKEYAIPDAQAGTDQIVCGLSTTLNAVPPNENGSWSGPGAVFEDRLAFNSEVTVPNYGTYTFYWFDNSPGCGIDQDEVEIQFTQVPNAHIQESMQVCGDTDTLTVFPSFGTGVLNDLDNVGWTFQDLGNGKHEVTGAYGSGRVTWVETSSFGCFDIDTMNLELVEPFSIDFTMDCGPLADTFNLDVTMTGGVEPYFINGKIESSPWESLTQNSGEFFQFIFADNSVCKDSLVEGPMWCDCSSLAGDFFGPKITVCELSATTVLPFYNNAHIFDPNDSVIFVVGDNPVFEASNFMDTVAYADGQISLQNDMEIGVTYYVFPVVLSKENGVVDLNDRCLSAGSPKMVEFEGALKLNAPDTVRACENDPVLVEFEIENGGLATFDLVTSGGTFAVSGSAPGMTLPVVLSSFGYMTIENTSFATNIPGCSVLLNDSIYADIELLPVAGILSQINNCTGTELPIKTDPLYPDHLVQWEFTDFQRMQGDSIVVVFDEPGTYGVHLIVTSENGCVFETDFPVAFDIQRTPDAAYELSPWSPDGVYCNGTEFRLTDQSTIENAAARSWELNGVEFETDSIIYFWMDTIGEQQFEIVVTTDFGCKDSLARTINLTGPFAEIMVDDPTEICLGTTLHLEAKNLVNVNTFEWIVDGGFSIFDDLVVDIPVNSLGSDSIFDVVFRMVDVNGCVGYQELNIPIKFVGATPLVDGDVLYEVCRNEIVNLTGDLSNGPANQTWYADGDLLGTNDRTLPANTLHSGINKMMYIAASSVNGCVDTTYFDLMVNNPPFSRILGAPDTLCLGASVELRSSQVEGITQFIWEPSSLFTEPNAAITDFSANVATTVSLQVENAKGCFSELDQMLIEVVAPTVLSPIADLDTTLRLGQEYAVHIDSTLYPGVSILWEPEEAFDCSNCWSQVLRPEEDVYYTATIHDRILCSLTMGYYNILVNDELVFDVPDAFSPNGDGYNDKIFVVGFGLDNLERFEIFDRYGVKVFATDNILEGWDGTYRGKPQPVETYVYKVFVRSATGFIEMKQGSFQLLR